MTEVTEVTAATANDDQVPEVGHDQPQHPADDVAVIGAQGSDDARHESDAHQSAATPVPAHVERSDDILQHRSFDEGLGDLSDDSPRDNGRARTPPPATHAADTSHAQDQHGTARDDASLRSSEDDESEIISDSDRGSSSQQSLPETQERDGRVGEPSQQQQQQPKSATSWFPSIKSLWSTASSSK
jgi:hypothetical protein